VIEMTRHPLRAPLALLLVAAATPAAATGSVGFDFTLHGGGDRYDVVTLRSGLAAADFTDEQRLRDTSLTVGATAIVRLGLLEVGVLGEVGRPGEENSTTTLGALAGVGLGLGRLRLEALGEAGGRRYVDALANPEVIRDSDRSDWLAYVGLRPGVSLRLGVNGNVILGVWGYARWDVTSEQVQVTLADLSGTGEYELGGSQVGAALRFGFSF
jgi:hypothetical protein